MDAVAELALRSHPEDQYLDLLTEVLGQPETRVTRNDEGTRSVFGRQIRFDMANGFPLLTTKRVHWHSIIAELLWFLRGETNVKSLQEQGVTIWDEWADPETGELGPVYGAQWRKWRDHRHEIIREIDQFSNLIKGLKEDPYSRRHIINSWNVGQLDDMKLPPCHCLMQFYVGSDGRVSLSMYQRSADIFLGVPFNIASYAALLHIVSAMVGREPGEFIHTFGDVHIYSNHTTQAFTQLGREPVQLPELTIMKRLRDLPLADIQSLKPEDFQINGYNPHPPIKAMVSK